MRKYRDENGQQTDDDSGRLDREATTRRNLLAKIPLLAGALAGGTLAGSASAQQMGDTCSSLKVKPVYFPKSIFTFPLEIDLTGKLAVITGASRGIGRSAGEILTLLGATVIGTSRDPENAPNPPDFPLLQLDVSDLESISAFKTALEGTPEFAARGQVDILVNNAGRFVFGQIVPQGTTNIETDYLANRDLAVRTLYSGHIALTSQLLPLMSADDYSRILFTTSIASYVEGSSIALQTGLDTYYEMKAALRIYANHLDTFLQDQGSTIKVSTVNPYTIQTALAEGQNPIYTQPVNADGLSETDEPFNVGMSIIRSVLANGIPVEQAGFAFAQLASMVEPPQNVVIGVENGELAGRGGNASFEAQLLTENEKSAVPITT